MSSKKNLLIGLVAISAFVVGWMLNAQRINSIPQPEIDATQLVDAQLQTSSEMKTVRANLKKLTLVNFWASWCTPCRQEMPIFETYYQTHKANGFQVIGIAIDNPEKTLSMLDSMGISYPILYAEQSGMQLMAQVGNAEGFLPYSLLLDAEGNVLQSFLGRIHEQQLDEFLSSYKSLLTQ